MLSVGSFGRDREADGAIRLCFLVLLGRFLVLLGRFLLRLGRFLLRLGRFLVLLGRFLELLGRFLPFVSVIRSVVNVVQSHLDCFGDRHCAAFTWLIRCCFTRRFMWHFRRRSMETGSLGSLWCFALELRGLDSQS